MTRKNFGVSLGRPIKTMAERASKLTKGGSQPAMSPMDSFSGSVPAASFNAGGKVNGHSCMPRHHDDPKFCRGGRS